MPCPSVPRGCKLIHSPFLFSAFGLKLNKESPEYINGVHLYNGFPNSYGKKLNSNCPESSYIELHFPQTYYC